MEAVEMRTLMAIGVAAMALGMPSLALAFRHGGGLPPCQQAETNIPWGTTDTSCIGGPPGPNGWTGGVGGPGMRISKQGHKNWPNYPGKVAGHGSVAGDPGGPPVLPVPWASPPLR
jgi:hypothetical protein